MNINQLAFLFPAIYNKSIFEEKKFSSYGSDGPERAWALIDQ